MINDLDSNFIETDNIESTSDKFLLKPFNFELPGQQSLNILCMSTSKKYIYLVTYRAELLCIESKTLKPVYQAYSFRVNETSSSFKFKEHFTRIWTDRAGNHSIIRYNERIFYFNSSARDVKELNIFKGIEICAIGFDDTNNNSDTTGNFLATDYDNNIYECNISIKIKNDGDYDIDDKIEKIGTIIDSFWDVEDEDEIGFSDFTRLTKERIYGIKIIKNTKKKADIQKGEDIYYIIAVTKTRIYEFRGSCEASFKPIFDKYNKKPILFNDCCKYFPPKKIKKNDSYVTNLDILYKNDRIEQFGWKTESGYCFGTFFFSGFLPENFKNLTVIPFAKITKAWEKEIDVEPISIVHTQNHIFLLFKDCLTIISKLTSNIIHSQYFQKEYKGLLYNEFSENNGIIFLFSKNGLFQISLKEENEDIWQDYLDIGDYANAQRYCNQNAALISKINRINADEYFEKNDYFNSAIKYIDSDEKFEVICLKYLMKNQMDALKTFLELYLTKSVTKDEKDDKGNKNKDKGLDENIKIKCNLITTLLIEIFLNKSKTSIEEFRQLIREKKVYLSDGSIILELLISYGKMGEFVEYSALMGDHETALLHYINEGQIDIALEKLTEYTSYIYDDETYKKLKQIFVNYSHIFFKKNPKDSIMLLQQMFKDVDMENIIQAIISTTDKDTNISSELRNVNAAELKISKKEDYSQTILSYLKSLIDKPRIDNDKDKIDQQNNIHNLYIYYLSKNKGNQEAIIEYLKGPLKDEDDQINIFHKKKEVLFQLDYAKKLFKNNIPAEALVLALMGKFSDGVKIALEDKSDESLKIAKFIASNAPGEKLKKQLWIDIFSCDSQKEFTKTLDIIKESKILKIEDVLPHITDTIKIDDFKKQISNCINDYEDNIKKLKADINEYNKTAENIKNDINKIKKKSMEITYSNCKCEICQGYIKNRDIFLFPCGHMFDAKCIRQCLLDYEITGLESVHETNKRIDELLYDLGKIDEKVFIDTNANVSKNINKINEDKKPEEQNKGLFSKIKIEIPVFKKQEIVETKVNINNIDKKKLEEELNSLLSKQCILCGDYMIDSVQCPVSKPEIIKPHKDGFKMRSKKPINWDFIE
jgi:hypothetical protein